MKYTPWSCSIAMLVLACGSGPRVLLPPHGNDPPEIQQACSRAEVRCSSCHTLDRIVSYSHHGRADWEKEVARMRLKPASGISPTDAELIVACLVYIDANRASAGLEWDPPARRRGGSCAARSPIRGDRRPPARDDPVSVRDKSVRRARIWPMTDSRHSDACRRHPAANEAGYEGLDEVCDAQCAPWMRAS